MIGPDEYNVILYPFGMGDVYGAVRVDDVGYPTIYINVDLSPEWQSGTLAHELDHGEQNDFTNHLTIYDAENKQFVTRPLPVAMFRAFRPLTQEEATRLALACAADPEMRRAADPAVPLAERLHILRRAKKLTRSELAEIVHVEPETVASWETGAASPDEKARAQLERLYAVALKEA